MGTLTGAGTKTKTGPGLGPIIETKNYQDWDQYFGTKITVTGTGFKTEIKHTICELYDSFI